jgi:hypothetical protein
MKKIRLIALDMDGTLLNSKKECSKRTKEVLKKAIAQGIYIVPATGRAINGLPACLAELDIHYGIFCNGASCYDLYTKELVAKTHFTLEEALTLLAVAEQYPNASHDVYAGGYGYCEGRYLDHFEEYTPDEHIEALIRSTRKRLDGSLQDFLVKHQMTVEKVNMFFKDVNERDQAKEALEATGLTHPVSALYNNLEMGKVGVSKGDALLKLGAFLGIESDEIMACGDAGNDLTMIVEAGIGVAMGNASEEIKKAADYITATNDEDGVAKAIEHFIGINE